MIYIYEAIKKGVSCLIVKKLHNASFDGDIVSSPINFGWEHTSNRKNFGGRISF